MKNILLFCVIFLTGCSTVVPLQRKFPEVPEVLMAKCDNLETIDKPTVFLSEFMTVITKNYNKYHNCSDLAAAWQQWYVEQKKIFDQANK